MSVTQVTTPSKIYYDINITNYVNLGNSPPPFVSFNESRSNPFLYDPEEYYLSILRFQLDTPSLPVFIPTITPFSSNANLTIYSVQLDWTNNAGTLFTSGNFPVLWSPEFQVAAPPAPLNYADGIQNNSTGYYYTLSYQWFAELVNQTISQAFAALNVACQLEPTYPYYNGGGVIPPPLTTLPKPLIKFVANTGLFTIEFPASGYSYDTTILAGTALFPIKLTMNAPLYQLFSSFPSVVSFPNSNSNLITLQTDNLTNIEYKVVGPTTLIVVTQEYSTIALWSPVTGITFTSNTLPIIPNQISSPIVYANGIQFPFSNTSNFQQIVTDFVSDNGIYKPSIVYQPTAEYRLIELLGNTPLSNLDINVFWKDRLGRFNPFTLTSGSSATIKILFTKKGSYQSK
jgi:hypothetical protein